MYLLKNKDKSEKLPASAVILAGGKGERIGGNKLFLSLDGIYLVESLIKKMSIIFDEVLLSVGNGESEAVLNAFYPLFQSYSVNLVEDRTSGRGPIEGLHAGLSAMNSKWGFLIGCDMPSPQEVVIHHMWNKTVELSEEYKVSVARFDGYIMPLHAFYHKDCSRYINSSIENAESECAVEDESKLHDSRNRHSFSRSLNLKSFYCCTKINVIEETELSIYAGWRRSFAGFNTDNELKSILGFLVYPQFSNIYSMVNNGGN
jgi:molybdopterin-guanine dinucleotide biosynthesis protein A